MHLRLLLSLPVGAVLLLVAPAASDASVGIGIQAGPVRLAGAAHAGGRYTLPVPRGLWFVTWMPVPGRAG